MNTKDITIVTGLSGSGKSTAIASLEDAGFYCVDNMPVDLLPKFLELPLDSSTEIAGLAFVMDLREKDFILKYPHVFTRLRKRGYNPDILFFEANEDVLIRRFSQTRRPHPLSDGKGIVEGIRSEKLQLEGLRKEADKVIDTSEMNVHELKSILIKFMREKVNQETLQITIISFGFKYGIPRDADLIIDVRFIQNPYFIPALKDLDGETDEVKNYVLNNHETRKFIEKYLDLLDYLIPLYKKEGKAYLSIAFGCTGGRHRSVAVARKVYENIANNFKQVEIVHRDKNQ